MGATRVLTADEFLAEVQAGNTKEANAAADAAVRDPDAGARTLAWAALTHLHTGRFDSAKKIGKRLEASPSIEALWARAALAVAFKPKLAPDLLAQLGPSAQGTAEYALLAGVSAHQHGNATEGDRWLHHVTVNPASVFATAAALGMRRRANQGVGRRIVQVLCAVVGALFLGLIGLVLGLVGAAAINRRNLQSQTTGAAHALLSVKTPRETHSNRESLLMFAKIIGFFAVTIALIVAVVQLT